MAAARSRPDETTEPWTVGRVLAWATADFRSRGIESARLDAELLLGQALGLDRIRLILEHQRPLAPGELSRYRALIKRRRSAEPIAYIRGEREFYGLPIRVDARVLIPRPDSETLVEVALERTRAWSMFGNALDLCTGSGCVAIAFAHARRTWRVTGVDASPGALDVARDNALRLGLVPGLRFVQGDLFAPLENERFELIMANPPYIPDAEMAELDAGIRDFEPRLALAGGADGLDVIRRLVEQAPRHLSPGGVLALEVGHDQAGRVSELFERAGLGSLERHRDYGGHERVVSGRWS